MKQVKSFFLELPKPALSEHSTSSPAAAAFHSSSNNVIHHYQASDGTNQMEEGIPEEDEDEDYNDHDGVGDDDDQEPDMVNNNTTFLSRSRFQNPSTIITTPPQTETEHNGLMQIDDMSEDVIILTSLGSPDDGSNNLESDYHRHLLPGSSCEIGNK